MKTGSKLATLVATGALIIAAATASANAASVATEAFLANVRPNIDFLDRSSRLALDHAASPRIRAFARSEAIEQTITANALVAWVQANTTRGAVGAVALPGTVVDVATAPVAVATDVVTGRSVAIEAPVAIDATPEARRELLPAGQTDLGRLAALNGRRFDALYRSTQRDALRQLSTLYAGYIQNGDDPQLRAMATTELPKVNRRLATMRGL